MTYHNNPQSTPPHSHPTRSLRCHSLDDDWTSWGRAELLFGHTVLDETPEAVIVATYNTKIASPLPPGCNSEKAKRPKATGGPALKAETRGYFAQPEHVLVTLRPGLGPDLSFGSSGLTGRGGILGGGHPCSRNALALAAPRGSNVLDGLWCVDPNNNKRVPSWAASRRRRLHCSADNATVTGSYTRTRYWLPTMSAYCCYYCPCLEMPAHLESRRPLLGRSTFTGQNNSTILNLMSIPLSSF